MSVTDEGYSRNVLCALNSISMFLLQYHLPEQNMMTVIMDKLTNIFVFNTVISSTGLYLFL
jgi:hypothetical protein